jgi:hypothetical protein
MSLTQIAKKHGTSSATVCRVMKKFSAGLPPSLARGRLEYTVHRHHWKEYYAWCLCTEALMTIRMATWLCAKSNLVAVAWSVMALAASGTSAAQVHFGYDTPVSERTSEVGCYTTATKVLDAMPQGPVFWHLYNYPTRAAAEAVRDLAGPSLRRSGGSGSTPSRRRDGIRLAVNEWQQLARCQSPQANNTQQSIWKRSSRRAWKESPIGIQDPKLGMC